MNWGRKLTVVFILFVIGIITMVTISMKQDFHLVADNYYEEEIAYQQSIDKQQNALKWKDTIKVEIQEERLHIKFNNAELVEGTITFFRPSNANLDFELPLVEELNVPYEKLEKGLWKITLNWEMDGQFYMKEHKLSIP